MWGGLSVSGVTEPISRDDLAKLHGRVDGVEEDVLIDLYISAAREMVEKYCGLSIATQTVTASCDGFGDLALLPVAPVTSIEITYVDEAGSDQTLDPGDYDLRGIDEFNFAVEASEWPRIEAGSRITVVMTAGFETPPAPIMLAMLKHVATSYRDREVSAEGDWSDYDSLLCNFRRHRAA